MKKLLTTTSILAFAIIATMAQEQQVSDELLKRIIANELCSGHMEPIEEDENGNIIPYILPTAENIATSLKIPPERMTRVLEEMVRDNLAIFEKTPVPTPGDRNAEDKYNQAVLDVVPLVEGMQTFYDESTTNLLKKCVISSDEWISWHAVETYVVIAGEKSFSFFRQIIEQDRLTPPLRDRLYQNLERVAVKLNEEKKVAKAEQITTFIHEMKQTVQPQPMGKPLEKITINFDLHFLTVEYVDKPHEVENIPMDEENFYKLTGGILVDGLDVIVNTPDNIYTINRSLMGDSSKSGGIEPFEFWESRQGLLAGSHTYNLKFQYRVVEADGKAKFYSFFRSHSNGFGKWDRGWTILENLPAIKGQILTQEYTVNLPHFKDYKLMFGITDGNAKVVIDNIEITQGAPYSEEE